MPRVLDECPVVVCTNTRLDYAIVARDELIDEIVANRIERQVAPAFRKTVESEGFKAAVGVMQSSDPDKLLAFRVFNVGTYVGRPHTIGVVGILVPRQPMRGWPLSTALSRLPAPTPGEFSYDLPPIELARLPQCNDPSFKAIDEWEEQGLMVPPHGAVCFCEPASPCPCIVWGEAPPKKPTGRAVRKTAILLMLATALFLAIVAIATFTGRRADTPPPAAHGLYRQPHEGEEVERSLLVEAMRRAHFQVSDFDASVSSIDKLRSQAAGAADHSRNNLQRLKNSIQSLRKGSIAANDIAPTIDGYLRKWKQESIPSLQQEVSREEASEAREFLNSYFELLLLMQETIRNPSDVGISALDEKLDVVLQRK